MSCHKLSRDLRLRYLSIWDGIFILDIFLECEPEVFWVSTQDVHVEYYLAHGYQSGIYTQGAEFI